ncbi:MAG: YfcE family phosphodiesterase [Chloroflexota bacterium]
MKIGIISDVHAQYQQLEKALKHLKRATVDVILCAGDLIDKGDNAEQVIRTMIHHKIPCVRGNHDEAGVSNQRWLRRSMDDDYVEETLHRLNRGEMVQTKLLSDRAIIYLQTLPFQLTFRWQQTRILLVHGSPQSNSQYLMPTMPDNLLQSFLADANADIIICGHTHSPMYRPLGKQLLLNSGSVCASPHNRESNTCAILTLPERRFDLISLDTGKTISLSE